MNKDNESDTGSLEGNDSRPKRLLHCCQLSTTWYTPVRTASAPSCPSTIFILHRRVSAFMCNIQSGA